MLRRGHLMASRLVLATVVATTLTFGSPAAAFTVESAFSDGCHEQITEAALRNVRATLATAPPIPPTPDEQALIADLPFTVPADMQDLASASLLVGVRTTTISRATLRRRRLRWRSSRAILRCSKSIA